MSKIDHEKLNRRAKTWSLPKNFLIFTAMGLVIAGCANPTNSIPEVPNWTDSLDSIKDRYPSGKEIRVEKEETHFQIVGETFGQKNVVITYCFKESEGLHLVFFEFSSEEDSNQFTNSNWISTDNANSLIQHLDQLLTDLFGPHTHESSSPGNGGLQVFGREHGEFIRLDHQSMAEGSSRVSIWTRRPDAEAPLSTDDRLLRAGLWRTDPSKWSIEEFFGVRWGMGSADVRDVYKDLTAILYDPDEPIASYDADDYIEGAVGIDFEFFRGKLTGFRISPTSYGFSSDVSNEKQWADWERWREKVMVILDEKYGSSEPGHVRSKFASDDDVENGPPNAWRWRVGSTGIQLYQLFKPVALQYIDLSIYEERIAAEMLYERHQEDEKRKSF